MSDQTQTAATPEWLEDSKGNRCSIAYFGSAEVAKTALDSLKNCENCTNCSRCSDCSGCSGCSHLACVWDARDRQGDPAKDDGPLGQPAVPVIVALAAAVLGRLLRWEA